MAHVTFTTRKKKTGQEKSQSQGHLVLVELWGIFGFGFENHLSKIKVEQTQGEELQADWETIQQPERQRLELVRLNNIFKVKREERRPQSRPEQTQKEKNTLVAEAFVSVVQNQPELQVNKHEEERIQNRVENRETELHVRGNRSLDQFGG